MAFGIWGKPKHISVTLIDIDSSSVGGAIMYSNPSTPPVLCYATRSTIETRENETLEEGMVRALQLKLRDLIEQGAPILRKETGSGHMDHVYVRVGTPWHQTLIRRERVEEKKPFIFTYALQKDILRKKGSIPAGFQSVDESIIATLLNGYETEKPFGKQARYAEVVIASSWVEERVAAAIQKVVRSAFHTHALTFTTPATVGFHVFHTLFPHEQNYLTLEITGEATDLSYIKNGILVKSSSLTCGVNDIVRHARDNMPKDLHTSTIIDIAGNTKFASSVAAAEHSWITKISELFKEFAAEQALPRTIFLVAPEGTRDYLARILDNPELRSLWLSDEPLRIIGIAPSQFVPFLSTGVHAEQDTALSLFALYIRTTIHTPLPKAG